MRTCRLSFVSARGVTGRRTVNTHLSLTSMLDVLVVAVVFLLTTFEASGSCAASIRVPTARNALDMVDAPTITVAYGDILLDGVRVGTDREIEGAVTPVRLMGLTSALRRQRELWRQIRPNVEPPGTIVLRMDQDTPAIVVKSVFATAGRAGYPNVSLMVDRLGE